MIAQKVTILLDTEKDTAEKTPKEIVCRKGHTYMKPFALTFNHNQCRICKHLRDKRYKQKPEAKHKRFKRELKDRIQYKKLRLERILSEQEISERNGRIQGRKDIANSH